MSEDLQTISERHKLLLEVFDIEVLVYDEGHVEVSVELPEPMDNFVLAIDDLTEIVHFVEKHGEVIVKPDEETA